MLENVVLRKLFELYREEVTAELLKWPNYSSAKYYSHGQIEELGMGVHVARMGEKRNPCVGLVVKPEGKRLLGRRGFIWEDIIKTGIKETR